MKLKDILAFTVMALPLNLSAQNLPKIQFESKDYKAISLYDSWEESPFRSSQSKKRKFIKRYVAITGNFLNQKDQQLDRVVNDSKKILALQRSRFGSNTFGVRIDLNEPFELTPTIKYLHVMVNRPYGGRVMVIGLGKRKNNPEQSKETEQFWAMSLGDVPANKWYDVVLPIKGNGGIDIHSLVVVPDCESPHNDNHSKVCYIDNICVNNESHPAVVYEYYPLNFDEAAENKSEQYLSSVYLRNEDRETQYINTNTKQHRYYTAIDKETLMAKAGETFTPGFIYNGDNNLHGYIYLDMNCDGRFNDKNIASSELIAFSNHKGKNSKNELGTHFSSIPSFTIPPTLKPGFYRMRYKLDTECLDASGSKKEGEKLTEVKGGVFDVRLNVYGKECNVSTHGLNGDLYAIDESGKEIPLNNYKVKCGQPLKVRIVPENGFTYNGIAIKHGYNLKGEEFVKDCRQWQIDKFDYIDFDDNNELVIPASCTDGEEMQIENFFVEDKGIPYAVNPSPQTNHIKTGFYLLKVTADKETGYVYSNGDKLVIDAQYALPTKVNQDQYKYLWRVTNDGQGNYQLENYMDGKCFGKDNFQTQMFKLDVPATYVLNEVSPNFTKGNWCFMETTLNGHKTFIHMNGTKGASKLGYWNNGAFGGPQNSLALFQFYEVSAIPRIKVTYNYFENGKKILETRKIQGPNSQYAAPKTNIGPFKLTYEDNKKVSSNNNKINVILTK